MPDAKLAGDLHCRGRKFWFAEQKIFSFLYISFCGVFHFYIKTEFAYYVHIEAQNAAYCYNLHGVAV
jgi:hypothetical protein